MKAMRKVLVVDDDPVVGKSIGRVLSGKGYAVITAASGEEALDRIAREDYDVVYTDIRMPGMNGLEVANRIRASRPWLPVVIVTGYGDDAAETTARQLGVSAFLHKPLSPQVIEDSAESLTTQTDIAVPPPKADAAGAPVPGSHAALRFTKNVALFAAAPFIGLAYILLAPVVGFGLLAYTGYKALVAPRKPE